MSCLRPLTIINPTKRLVLDGGAPFEIQVPCGSCPNCRQSKHDEYYFRSWYEARSTFDNGGFVQAVTLTYRPSCLPHLSDFLEIPKGDSLDFPCFSRRDIRLFIMRLRERLARYGYDVRNNLGYFICTEYGTSQGHQHLPHMHCLFYVNFPIDALLFSRFVGAAWPFGITDTFPFKSARYVTHYTFGHKYTADAFAMQKKCMYVSKYVLKSSSFDKQIKRRVTALVGREYDLKGSALRDFIKNDGRSVYNSYLRLVNQFHRQCNHFGSALWKYNDIHEVLKSGMISIYDSHSIVRHIPLPMYYQRRLFYDMVKDFRGVRSWQLNDLGRTWLLNRKLDSVQLLARSFSDWFQNLRQYLPQPSELLSSADIENEYHSLNARVCELLDGRSWFDFACYVGIYKGRIKNIDETFRDFLDAPSVDGLETWACGLLPKFEECQKFCYNYTSKSDYELFGSRFLSFDFLGDSVVGVIPSLYKYHRKDNSMSLRDFISTYVINDSADPRFRGFDELYRIYCNVSSWRADSLTAASELRADLDTKFSNKQLHL